MNEQPSAQAFREYSKVALMLPPIEGDPNDTYEEDIRRAHSHPVYRWITKQQGFKAAWAQVKRKTLFNEHTSAEINKIPADYWLVHLTYIVARCFASYLSGNLPVVVHTSDRKRALEQIRSLQILIANGVGFADKGKNAELSGLLLSLSVEIVSSPLTGPTFTRKSPKLPIRQIVRDLAAYFRSFYEEDCPTAVYELVELMEPGALSIRSIQREITKLNQSRTASTF